MVYINNSKYFGDERFKHRVIHTKNSYTECIYCSKKADTREHLPSKAFLRKPYPENLATLPACYKCNNSFSEDELLVSLAIQMMKKEVFKENYVFDSAFHEKFEDIRNFRKIEKIKNAIETNDLSEIDEAFRKVLTKLARGHAVWDLTIGYYEDYSNLGVEQPEVRMDYFFLDELSKEQVEEFTSNYCVTNEALPELGSRIYESRLRVFEKDNDNPELIVLWGIIQEGEYAYNCYKSEDTIEVKIIINDFLFAIIQIDDYKLTL